MQDIKASTGRFLDSLAARHVDVRLLGLLAAVALCLIIATLWLALSDRSRRSAADAAASEGQRAVQLVEEVATAVQRVLDDAQVQALALRALQQPETINDLRQYVSGRMHEIDEVMVLGPDLSAFDPSSKANGYALLDMLLLGQRGGFPPLQIHHSLQPPKLVDLAVVRSGEEIAGYLVVMAAPDFLLAQFRPDIATSSYISLSQNNGRQPPSILKQVGTPDASGQIPLKLPVSGTLFRIETPSVFYVEFISRWLVITALIVGLVTLALAVFLFRKSREWDRAKPPRLDAGRKKRQARPNQPQQPAVARIPARQATDSGTRRPAAVMPGAAKEPSAATPSPLEAPDPPPMRLRYDISDRARMKTSGEPPVELTSGIFRAYDIRGIVGKTLDGGIAEQVGRVLGSLALEKQAGPVVVARDGRLSGPDLVAGMVRGITSSGCDVLDIGAVPTGVLYFAAHELAAGTGVVITGSHNPPDYNGFKIMLAGDTLYGDQISAIYRRMVEADYRVGGDGKVERKDVLGQYRERIASDIKLERPLRVVIDCGNGIGGVCAADVLRDIGAEVLPLFDEVDGTFPNHHPDPSEPENLKDLIEAVRLMNADLGLALDGDADRLGVVTLGGSIIYPDRVMMLLAMDVLDRVPGATIIYDVKCSNHLAQVIREAGGKPMMYKTGHSLIKAKMKEIGCPFGGEMSGHFFFAERWYGVDDGIYAAARLLEILAGAEAPPEAILNALPTSFSTPELKVQMGEGENHAFVDALQARARFDGATVTTIDGVRADFPDGWGLVRASNTTPILVVRFDAKTETALERIKNIFRARMLAINPDLELPF